LSRIHLFVDFPCTRRAGSGRRQHFYVLGSTTGPRSTFAGCTGCWRTRALRSSTKAMRPSCPPNSALSFRDHHQTVVMYSTVVATPSTTAWPGVTHGKSVPRHAVEKGLATGWHRKGKVAMRMSPPPQIPMDARIDNEPAAGSPFLHSVASP